MHGQTLTGMDSDVRSECHPDIGRCGGEMDGDHERTPPAVAEPHVDLMLSLPLQVGAVDDVEQRQADRADFHRLTERLAAEFVGTFSAVTVIRAAGRAREELLVSGVRAGLLYATESMTRQRLWVAETSVVALNP